MPNSYAKDTTVSIERSKAELEQLLRRFGATQYVTGWNDEDHSALIGFQIRGRRMRFRLDMPDPADPQFAYTKVNQTRARKLRSQPVITAAWEQACKERWRALILLIKAKLAAVEAGITTIEEQFLPNVMLVDGSTVQEWLDPQVDQAVQSGRMPPLLPGTRPLRSPALEDSDA